MPEQSTRRDYIRVASFGAFLSLSGCLGPDNVEDQSENRSSTSNPDTPVETDLESPETTTTTESETETGNQTETETKTETEDGETESGDTNGPVIQDFSISGGQFNPGETMVITVEVSDPNEVSRVYFRFENQSGGGAVYDAYRDFSPPVGSGTYTIEYQWPEDTPAGTYEATWIHAEDSIGNRSAWDDNFSESKKQIEITSDTSDTEGPVITEFTISDEEFSPGDTMQIDVEVSDQTGISRIYFRFENQDGGGAVFDAYRDFSPATSSGTHTIEYQWPDDTPGGTYEATWIYAEDSIGNKADWTNSFSAEKKQITINSEVSDTEGPVIQDFNISDNEFEPGETMQIEAEVTDETDITRIYFRFEHADGGGAVYDAYRDFSPPVGSGTYTIEYQWPEDTSTGTYQATWIFAEDSIGNTADWTDSFSNDKKQVDII